MSLLTNQEWRRTFQVLCPQLPLLVLFLTSVINPGSRPSSCEKMDPKSISRLASLKAPVKSYVQVRRSDEELEDSKDWSSELQGDQDDGTASLTGGSGG